MDSLKRKLMDIDALWAVRASVHCVAMRKNQLKVEFFSTLNS